MQVSQEPLLTIDLTPTPDLAIRILKAYWENCQGVWQNSTGGFEETPEGSIMARMNEDQRARAKILDEAIKELEKIQFGKTHRIGTRLG